MPKLIIQTKSLKLAKVLAEWYAGQGEQSSEFWLEESGFPLGAYVDMNYGIKVDEDNETVTIKVG